MLRSTKPIQNLAVSLALLIATPALAEGKDKLVATINQGIQQAFPKIEIVSATRSPIKGLYQVEARDGVIFYTDKSGSIFAKELFRIEQGQTMNLADSVYAERRSKHMTDIDRSELITFEPESQSRGEIFVFTDVNCPYCRKFHQQLVPKANKLGITVNYFAYPVIGGEKSMKQMQSAWCAAPEQRAELLTTLKNGGSVEDNLCDNNPVEKHLAMGRDMKITGTPTVLFDDGSKADLQNFEAALKAHFGGN